MPPLSEVRDKSEDCPEHTDLFNDVTVGLAFMVTEMG